MTFTEVSIYFFLIFVGVGALLLMLSLVFYKKYRSKKNNCTVWTEGTVYRFANREPVGLPVVRYEVRGVFYKAMLEYRYYTETSTPGFGETTIKDTPNSDALRIRTNNTFTNNPLRNSYPIGSKMKVCYNPSRPKESYVLRLVKSSVITVFWIVGLAFVVASIPFLVVFFVN